MTRSLTYSNCPLVVIVTMAMVPASMVSTVQVEAFQSSLQMNSGHTTRRTFGHSSTSFSFAQRFNKQQIRSSSSSSFSSSSSSSLHAFDLSDNNVLSDIESFYETAPYTAAFVTCSIKASAADLLAQTSSFSNNSEDKQKTDEEEAGEEEAKRFTIESNPQTTFIEETALNNVLLEQSKSNAQSQSQSINSSSSSENNSVEIQQNLAFILYGGLYQGLAQQYLYNSLFPAWFGTGNDIVTVLTKVSFDLIVISPLICIPIAYLVKAMIYGQSLKEGLEKYGHDLRYKNLLLKYYSIWFPAGLCSFGLVPDHLRIAFIAFVSFFWLIILSIISSSKEGDEELVVEKQ